MTWKDIEKEGGISIINKDLKECYNVWNWNIFRLSVITDVHLKGNKWIRNK
jgi:hypothetical protein